MNSDVPFGAWLKQHRRALDLSREYLAGQIGCSISLLEKIETYFEPFRKKREELMANLDHVEQVLEKGAAKARPEARKTLLAARKACGID